MQPLILADHLCAGDSDAQVLNNGPHWVNDLYVRIVRLGAMTVLTIKPSDGARHGWREFQWMKNQLCGDDAEAVELYPVLGDQVIPLGEEEC